MILFLECVIVCFIFGAGITVSIFAKPTAWLHEYPVKVQERFLELNPEFKEKKEKNGGKYLIIGRIVVATIFMFLLALLGYISGARTFVWGFINTYIIWSVVNIFDVIVLDLGIFMYWKKIRLPGTEDMDEAYKTNKLHHVLEGVYGILIGLPVCLLAGALVSLV